MASYQVVLLLLSFLGVITQGSSHKLQFSFSPSEKEGQEKLRFVGYPSLSGGALHVSPDLNHHLRPFYRVIYQEPFESWRRSRHLIGGLALASFNTTFAFNFPKEESSHGHTFAFSLTSHPMDSSNSHEVLLQFSATKCNSTGVGTIEVSLKNSSSQVPRTLLHLNLSSGLASDVKATVRYDGKSKILTIQAFPHYGANGYNTSHLDLSKVLLRRAYVGFTASSANYTIKLWNFSSKDAENRKWVIVCIPTTIVATILFFVIILVLLRLRMRSRPSNIDKRRRPSLDLESVLVDSTIGPHRFRLKQLKAATKNFDPMNKLGQGGFGTVYKGSLNKVTMDIAVKRVSKDSLQTRQEFLAEVTTFSSIRHKNLVKLLGWCYEEDELLLVYELLPKGSLDKLIFSKDEDMVLSWERRHGIITGVASALCYLHDGCEMKVLHRDVKASNVMVDSDYNARLGDFGLALTVERNGVTHHSTNAIVGTPGYISPEYYLTGRASAETDVYGFGVFVLEVACGRRPGDLPQGNIIKGSTSSCSCCYICNIVDWVWDLYAMGRLLEAVDCRLHGEYDLEEMEDVLVLGLACCHPNPHERPPMSVALQVLRGEVAAPVPPLEKPAFVWPVNTTFSGVVDSLSSDDSASRQ